MRLMSNILFCTNKMCVNILEPLQKLSPQETPSSGVVKEERREFMRCLHFKLLSAAPVTKSVYRS